MIYAILRVASKKCMYVRKWFERWIEWDIYRVDKKWEMLCSIHVYTEGIVTHVSIRKRARAPATPSHVATLTELMGSKYRGTSCPQFMGIVMALNVHEQLRLDAKARVILSDWCFVRIILFVDTSRLLDNVNWQWTSSDGSIILCIF